jgi:hypothetical protein
MGMAVFQNNHRLLPLHIFPYMPCTLLFDASSRHSAIKQSGKETVVGFQQASHPPIRQATALWCGWNTLRYRGSSTFPHDSTYVKRTKSEQLKTLIKERDKTILTCAHR